MLNPPPANNPPTTQLQRLRNLRNLANSQGMDIKKVTTRVGQLLAGLRFTKYLLLREDSKQNGKELDLFSTGYELFSTYLTYCISKFAMTHFLKSYLRYTRGYYLEKPDWGYNKMKLEILEIEKDRLSKSEKLYKDIGDAVGRSQNLIELIDQDQLKSTSELRSQLIEDNFQKHLFDDPTLFIKSYKDICHQNPFTVKFAISIHKKTEEMDDFLKKISNFAFIEASLKKSENQSELDTILLEIRTENPEILEANQDEIVVFMGNLKKLIKDQKKHIPQTREIFQPKYPNAPIAPSSFSEKVLDSENLEIIAQNFKILAKTLNDHELKDLYTLETLDSDSKDYSKDLKLKFTDEEICEIFKRNLRKFKSSLIIKDAIIEDDSRKRKTHDEIKTVDKKSFDVNLKDAKLDETQLQEIFADIKKEIKALQVKKLDQEIDVLVTRLSDNDRDEEFTKIITKIKKFNDEINALDNTRKNSSEIFKDTFEELSFYLLPGTENQFEFSKEKFDELMTKIPENLSDEKFFKIEKEEKVVKLKFNKNIAFKSDSSIRDYAFKHFTALQSAILEISDKEIEEAPIHESDKVSTTPPHTDPLAVLVLGQTLRTERDEITKILKTSDTAYIKKDHHQDRINFDDISQIDDFYFGILNHTDIASDAPNHEQGLKGIFHRKMDDLVSKIATDSTKGDRVRSLIYFLLDYSSGDSDAIAMDIFYLDEQNRSVGNRHGQGHASKKDATQLKKLIKTLDKLEEIRSKDSQKLNMEKLEAYLKDITKEDPAQSVEYQKSPKEIVENLCKLLAIYPETDTLKFAKQTIWETVFPDKTQLITPIEFIENKDEIIQILSSDCEKFKHIQTQFDTKYREIIAKKNGVSR